MVGYHELDIEIETADIMTDNMKNTTMEGYHKLGGCCNGLRLHLDEN